MSPASLARTFRCAAIVTAWTLGAAGVDRLQAACEYSIPVAEPPGSGLAGRYTACDDTFGVSSLAWLQSDPLGLNSGIEPIVCEETGTFCLGGGVLGDGRVVLDSDWNRSGFTGCPINGDESRLGLVIQGSDGGGLLALLTRGRFGGEGYFLLGAQQYDFSSGDVVPLACGSSPEILSVTPGPGYVQIAVRFPAPAVVTDCDAGSFATALAGPCAAPPVVNPTAGPIYTRTGPCSTRLDLHRAAWTTTGVLPDANGEATIIASELPQGACLYVGETTLLEGIESGAMTSFARVSGPACADLDGDGVTDCDGDCDDDDATRAPNHAEVCDFSDNDCDGRIDEGLDCPGTCPAPVKNGPTVRVTNYPGDSLRPSIAATGSAYGVTWTDRRSGRPRVWLALLQPSGARSGPDIPVNEAGHPDAIAVDGGLVWSGSQFGALWRERFDNGPYLYFARMAPTGARLAPPIDVDPGFAIHNGAVAVVPGGYALIWTRQNPTLPLRDIYFRTIAANGSLGAIRQVTSLAALESSEVLAWNGTHFLVAWTDDRVGGGSNRLYAALLDADGTRLGPDVQVSTAPNTVNSVSIAAAGDGFGLAWEALMPNGRREIFAARMDAQGNRLTEIQVSPQDVATSSNPGLIWTGAEFRIVWADSRQGGSDIYVATLDALGTKVGTEFAVTQGNQHVSSDGRLALAEGGGVAVVWGDRNSGNQAILFARIGCYCIDADGDGYESCMECDDTQSAINPGASESCNGVDDNCNGVVDEGQTGLDPDGDGAAEACDNCPSVYNPGQGDVDADGQGDLCDLDDGLIYMLARDKTFIDWQQEAGVTSFNLYRGLLPGLTDPDHDGAASHYGDCVASHIGSTTYGDATLPPLGKAYLYIVTGVNLGVESGFGVASSGASRPNDAPCP